MSPNLTAIEVLDQMHAAILAADFAALADLTPALESCLDAVQGLQNGALARKIRAKAERNAACLQASGRGVRAAQRRLTDLRNAGSSFSTYDGSGRRETHGLTNNFARRF